MSDSTPTRRGGAPGPPGSARSGVPAPGLAAWVAVGHAILVIIYHILSRQEAYQDLGANYFDERDRQAVQRRLVRRLEQLGYQVTVQPAPAPPEPAFSE